jgi:thiamine biosynthesis lipoprotein
MGTLFRITLYAPDVDTAHSAFDAAFARVHQLDEILSDYNPSSELMRLSTEPTRISDELLTVLRASQELAAQTEGAFDITLGPVIQLWRKARREKALPQSDAIAGALQRTGYQKLILANHTAALAQPGMQLDVGGIAKGYAADEALRILRGRGLPNALVAASGDITIADKPMTIAVEPSEGLHRKISLHNAAVSTSGDTEQFLEINGKHYSHIVDPKTGVGLTSRIGVAVIAPDGITADSAATAICVLGAKRGLQFARKHPELSVWIAQDGKTLAATGRFVDMLP